jgi:hypothetical protein
MKKVIAIAVATALMSGCSTFQSDPDPIENVSVNTTEAEFLTENGGLEIEFTDSGEWTKITSTGIAQIQTDRINSTEEAIQTATLRAKANIVEFLNQDVRSKKTLDALSEQYLSENAGVDPSKGDQVSRKLTENISSDAHALIRGAMYGERNFDEDARMVSVELIMTPQAVSAAKTILIDMRAKR